MLMLILQLNGSADSVDGIGHIGRIFDVDETLDDGETLKLLIDAKSLWKKKLKITFIPNHAKRWRFNDSRYIIMCCNII